MVFMVSLRRDTMPGEDVLDQATSCADFVPSEDVLNQAISTSCDLVR